MIWNTKNAQSIRMPRVEFMLVKSARVSRKTFYVFVFSCSLSVEIEFYVYV